MTKRKKKERGEGGSSVPFLLIVDFNEFLRTRGGVRYIELGESEKGEGEA